MGQSLKEYCKDIETRGNPHSVLGGSLGINLDCYKMLKKGMEDINHEEGTDNSLNEYKLDDQTLKLVKGRKDFPHSGKSKSKNPSPYLKYASSMA